MNNRSLTIRLDEELEQGLDAACAETGRSRGEIVRDALRRQLQLMRFEQLGCVSCDHTQLKPRRDGLISADPRHCPYCNP